MATKVANFWPDLRASLWSMLFRSVSATSLLPHHSSPQCIFGHNIITLWARRATLALTQHQCSLPQALEDNRIHNCYLYSWAINASETHTLWWTWSTIRIELGCKPSVGNFDRRVYRVYHLTFRQSEMDYRCSHSSICVYNISKFLARRESVWPTQLLLAAQLSQKWMDYRCSRWSV